MYLRNPLVKIGLLGLLFSTTACDTSKDDKDSPADQAQSRVLELGLQGTHWEQCAFRFKHTSTGEADIVIYQKFALDFVSSSQGKVVAQYFTKDKDCKEKISAEEAKALSSGEVDEVGPQDADDMTLIISATPNTDLFNVDSIFPKMPEYNSYYVAKISADTIEIADRCFGDYVTDGVCKKEDGDRPDNRATAFGLFGDDDRNIFTKVK
jgi:hypothetical protein